MPRLWRDSQPTQALHEAGQSLWLDNITRTRRQVFFAPRRIRRIRSTWLCTPSLA